MKERPILMSAPMVRAILGGTKTQTRRVMKHHPTHFHPAGLPRVANPHSGPSAVLRCPYGQPGDRLWVHETFAKIDGQTRPWIETDYRATYAHGDRLGDHLGMKKRWTPAIHMPRAASRITLEIAGVRVERLRDISDADALAEGIFELVPPLKRSEGPTPTALAFAAAATVVAMPAVTRRRFLGGALAASLGITASPAHRGDPIRWERVAARMKRAPSAVELYAALWESINGIGSWEANPWVWVIGFRRLDGLTHDEFPKQ